MPKKRSSGDGGLFYIPSRKLWRGVIDVGFWPDGRRRQKTVTSRTQRGAREKLEQIKSDLDENDTPLDRKTTLEAWSAIWLATICRPNLKPSALNAYESITRKWIVPTLGRKKVAAIKPSDVLAVHQAVREAGRSSATNRKVHNVLSGMLEAARLQGLAKRNVAEDVKAPAVLSKERGALGTEDARAVLLAARSLPDGSRWWAALLGGLRQSERLGARIDSLDLDRGILKVEWSLDEIPSEHGCGTKDGTWPCGKARGGSCPQRRLKVPDGFEHIPLRGRLALVRPKSGKARSVPLIPAHIEQIREHLARTADEPNPFGLIWHKSDGSPHLPGEDGQAWRDLLFSVGMIDDEQRKEPKDRAPGTPDIPTTHWARHTTATVLMELGVDAKVIGSMIGHVDAKTTQHYQHVSDELASSEMRKQETHYAKALGS